LIKFSLIISISMQILHKKIIALSIFLSGFFFISGALLQAQVKGNLIKDFNLLDFPFTITEYNSEHGLYNNHAYSILKNPDNGDLIISSTNYLLSFNGYEFGLVTSTENTRNFIFYPLYPSLSKNKIYGYGGKKGFYELYPNFELIAPNFKLSPLGRGFIGLGENGEVTLYEDNKDPDTLANLKTPSFKNILSFENKIFLVNERETNLLDIKGNQVLPFFKDELIKVVYDSLEQTAYFLFKNNLFSYKEGALSAIPLTISTEKPSFSDFLVLPEGILIGSRNGLLFHTQGVTSYFTMENSGLPSNIINSLYSFDENIIFASTGTSGILKLERKKAFSSFDKGITDKNSFTSIVNDEEGNLYSGSNKQLFKLNEGHFTLLKSLPSNIASLSLIDNKFFVGTWNSAVYVLDREFNVVEEVLRNKTTYGAFKDSKNNYWFGTNDGVYVGKSLKDLKPLLQERIQGVYSIFMETSDNKLIIGGEKEMFVLDSSRTTIEYSTSCEALNCLSFRGFLEESPGKYWIATMEGGLVLLENQQQISLITQKGNLLPKDIFTLALDSLGNLLMSSNNGINVIALDKVNDFLSGKIKHLIPINIGTSLGLYNSELNGFFQNNFAQLANGEFYFPGVSGITKVPTQKYPVSTHTPKITGILINDQPVSQNLSLYGKETQIIKFKFAIPSFSSLENNYYQYKLVKNNVDTEWSPPQKLPELDFLLLGSGKYSLYLKSINSANVPNPSFLKFDFEIEPYLYEMLWFKFAVIMFPLGIFVFIIYFYIKVKSEKEKFEDKMSLVAMELQLSSIFTKINPHLIFNSLNALNFFISVKDSEKSSKLLDAFSKMLRQGLEENEKSFLPLSKEMELLKNYLTVQKLRLDESFQFSVTVDKNVMGSLIPNNIFLPIAEYILNTSLSQRDDKNGILLIDCKKEQETLFLTLSHNGQIPCGINYNNEIFNSLPLGLNTLKQLLTLYAYKFGTSIVLESQIKDNGLEKVQIQNIKIFEND